VNNTVHKRHRN